VIEQYHRLLQRLIKPGIDFFPQYGQTNAEGIRDDEPAQERTSYRSAEGDVLAQLNCMAQIFAPQVRHEWKLLLELRA